SDMIRAPDDQAQVIDTLERLNGEGVIAPELRSRRSLNSVNNLSKKSPILKALDRIPTRPGVPYHTIAYFLGGRIPYDLLVPYQSAHLEGAASEVVFPGTHFSQQSQETSNELRRILIEHVGGLTPVVTASPPPPP
ncbi:MAG: lysophospholipase, partial [Isosphaeraceae bacterium]